MSGTRTRTRPRTTLNSLRAGLSNIPNPPPPGTPDNNPLRLRNTPLIDRIGPPLTPDLPRMDYPAPWLNRPDARSPSAPAGPPGPPDGNDPDGDGDDGDDGDDDQPTDDDAYVDAEEVASEVPPPGMTRLDWDGLRMIAKYFAEANKQPASAKSKVKDPEAFDGADPSKLRTFFLQCELVFRARPDTYRDSEAKINYAILNLKGTAQRWFEPYIIGADNARPIFLTNWLEFKAELSANFGEADPVGNAEAKLSALRMEENHRVARYNTDFNLYASQVGWNDDAKYYAYYKGLPSRLKDQLVIAGKPRTLSGLREVAQQLDLRYWERREEAARESRSKPSTSTPSTSSHQPKTTNSSNNQKNRNTESPGSNTRTQSENPNRSSSSRPSDRNSSPPKNQQKPKASTPKPDLSGKLTKSGKLTPEEKQRRQTEGLCAYCAKPDHAVENCPVKPKEETKARKAKAKPDNSAPSAESSKN